MVVAKESTLALSKQSNKETSSAEDLSTEAFADDLPDDFVLPPTDLYSDEPPLESDLHLHQIILLLSSLEWIWQDRQDFYASGNMTVYFSQKKIKTRDFRGPDFFVVLDTERRPRKSWTIWEEDGKYPNVIVEILSDSTAKVDRTTKKELYQNTFRTPEYFWFDPVSLEFAGFILQGGQYESIGPNQHGWLWSKQLNLFLGIHNDKLRYFTVEEVLVPSPQEAAKAEQDKAQAVRQAAQQEVQAAQQEVQAAQQEVKAAQQEVQAAQQEAQAAVAKADRLAQRLHALGIDPDSV